MPNTIFRLVERLSFPVLLACLLQLDLASVRAESSNVLTPLDVAQLRSVLDAAISPDGKWIAYTVSVPRHPLKDENGSARSELHVVEVATGNSRPFISGDVSVGGISWTPDGAGISFLTRRGKDKQTSLYVIPVDGGEARKLIEHDTSISGYDWKPDGSEVAFLATEKEDPEVKKQKDKGFNAEAYEENLHSKRIWISSAAWDSDRKPRMLGIEGSATELHWSPDGKQLVSAVAPTPLIDHHFMYRRIRSIDAAAGTVAKMIENPVKIGEIAWSPDGKHLAFMSGVDINDPSDGQLMVADVATAEFWDATKNYVPDVVDLHWISETRIGFLAANSCLTESGSVELDGSNRKSVSHGRIIVHQMSVSDDNSLIALVADSPTHSLEVFISTRADVESTRRLTDVNPWLKDRQLAKQHIVSYKARDGEKVEGILIRPLHEEEGQQYPLLTVVHGGPEAHISNGWTTRYAYPGQVAAARGFAIFYPNYRGSTGRGVPFRKAHQADYGGKEFDDVLDGIDYLVKSGLVDRSKVGVTGGSYGGFASAWMATRHSERFAAAVMFVGISNQISKSGTTDIADEMFHVHARKRIWDDWQFFLERSPIYYVEKARTPILILHGKEDTRVHPSQSMELYRNLKILGKVPVRLIFYPGEGHGNRKAAARYDYNLRMLRWMEHFITGPGGEAPPVEIEHDPKKPAESESDS